MGISSYLFLATLAVAAFSQFRLARLRRQIWAVTQALIAADRGYAPPVKIALSEQRLQALWVILKGLLERVGGGSSHSELEPLLNLSKLFHKSESETGELAHQICRLMHDIGGADIIASAVIVAQDGQSPSRIIASEKLDNGRIRSIVVAEIDRRRRDSLNELQLDYFVATQGSSLDLRMFGVGTQLILPFKAGSEFEGCLWLGLPEKSVSLVKEQRLRLRSLAEFGGTLLAAAYRLRKGVEEGNTQRSQILGLSHDLRHPGVSAIYALEELLGDGDSLFNAAQRDKLLLMQSSLDEQMSLISDLFDGVRHADGSMRKAPAEIPVIRELTQISELYKARALRSGLGFEIVGEPAIVALCDPTHFRRIVGNLLSNALKYTQNGNISIACFLVGRTVCCEFRDTGIGISRSEQSLLFSEYFRADNAKQAPGIGIGLANARRLAEVNGGALCFVPAEGAGSIFRFEVPGYDSSERRIREEQLKARSGIAKFLESGVCLESGLVVDDEIGSARYVSRYLTGHCRRVFIATSASEARAIFKKQRVDLLVSDLHLGSESGVGLIQELRRLNPNARTVLMTGVEPGADVLSANLAESVAVLTKPISRSQLLEALSTQVA